PESWTNVLAQIGYGEAVLPASDARALGHQVIVARSDGLVRSVSEAVVEQPNKQSAREVRSRSTAAATSRTVALRTEAIAASRRSVDVDRLREIVAAQLAAVLDIPADDIAYHESF